jgi:hypothetical protein
MPPLTRSQAGRGNAGLELDRVFVVIMDQHGHKVDEVPIADV